MIAYAGTRGKVVLLQAVLFSFQVRVNGVIGTILSTPLWLYALLYLRILSLFIKFEVSLELSWPGNLELGEIKCKIKQN